MNSDNSSRAGADLESITAAVETLRVFTGTILISFSKQPQVPRDHACRNFIARGMACVDSIALVWRSGSEPDAWILHRSLLDRLFHLHDLVANDSFLSFEKWSFISMYEARHKLLSAPEMREKVTPGLRQLQIANREKYQRLLAEKPSWTRPKALDVAKVMGLRFLYDFGYDYASTHVHPMASDGEEDAARLITPPHEQQLPDPTVIRNSILVQTLLTQEALNASTLRWRAIVYNFLDELRTYLDDGSPQFHETFYRMAKAWPGFELCEAMV